MTLTDDNGLSAVFGLGPNRRDALVLLTPSTLLRAFAGLSPATGRPVRASYRLPFISMLFVDLLTLLVCLLVATSKLLLLRCY